MEKDPLQRRIDDFNTVLTNRDKTMATLTWLTDSEEGHFKVDGRPDGGFSLFYFDFVTLRKYLFRIDNKGNIVEQSAKETKAAPRDAQGKRSKLMLETDCSVDVTLDDLLAKVILLCGGNSKVQKQSLQNMTPEVLCSDLAMLKALTLNQIVDYFAQYKSVQGRTLDEMPADAQWAGKDRFKATVITKDGAMCEIEYLASANGYRVGVWMRDVKNPTENEVNKLKIFNNGLYFIEINEPGFKASVDPEVKTLLQRAYVTRVVKATNDAIKKVY